MGNGIPVFTIEKLLSLNWKGRIGCSDRIDKVEKVAYGIGNICIPDHTLTCYLPREIRRQYGSDRVQVPIHIVWLKSDSSRGYSGLVADKSDCKLYFADIDVGDEDSGASCVFEAASTEGITELANQYNVYLKNVAELALTDKEQLLHYQIYSCFSKYFYYVEIPFEDRVMMCGAGLNDNRFWMVGWLGKLINKDLFISYAECTLEAYEQLKREHPSLFDRGRLMEKNKHLFSFCRTVSEKKKKYPALVEILVSRKKEPLSTRNVACFAALPKGTVMQEYNGPALPWMEDLLIACSHVLRKG